MGSRARGRSPPAVARCSRSPRRPVSSMECPAASMTRGSEPSAFRSMRWPRRSSGVSEPRTPSGGRRPLVWIVDDSPTEALIAERSLGSAYDFERFLDGSVVVERLAAGAPQPDLVLLDWVMPGMAGDEVCRFLRTDPRTLELPIILITASRIETSDVVNGLASGAND